MVCFLSLPRVIISYAFREEAVLPFGVVCDLLCIPIECQMFQSWLAQGARQCLCEHLHLSWRSTVDSTAKYTSHWSLKRGSPHPQNGLSIANLVLLTLLLQTRGRTPCLPFSDLPLSPSPHQKNHSQTFLAHFLQLQVSQSLWRSHIYVKDLAGNFTSPDFNIRIVER